MLPNRKRKQDQTTITPIDTENPKKRKTEISIETGNSDASLKTEKRKPEPMVNQCNKFLLGVGKKIKDLKREFSALEPQLESLKQMKINSKISEEALNDLLSTNIKLLAALHHLVASATVLQAENHHLQLELAKLAGTKNEINRQEQIINTLKKMEELINLIAEEIQNKITICTARIENLQTIEKCKSKKDLKPVDRSSICKSLSDELAKQCSESLSDEFQGEFSKLDLPNLHEVETNGYFSLPTQTNKPENSCFLPDLNTFLQTDAMDIDSSQNLPSPGKLKFFSDESPKKALAQHNLKHFPFNSPAKQRIGLSIFDSPQKNANNFCDDLELDLFETEPALNDEIREFDSRFQDNLPFLSNNKSR